MSGKLSKGRDLIVMKLKLDVSWHLPDVCTRFQVHISKHVEKKVRKLSGGGDLCWDLPSECLWPPSGQKLPNHEENQYSSRENPKNMTFAENGTYIEKYTVGHLYIKFE